MSYQNIPSLLEDVVRSHGSEVAYRFKKDGEWHDLSWSDFADQANRAARSLIALDVGEGDRVGVLSQTRLEWLFCDFGIISAAGVTVGIYQSSVPEECAYILNHCEAEILFVENREQLDKILGVRGELPRLRRIVVFDGPGDAAAETLSWDEFLALGDDVPDARLAERQRASGPEHLASLVYTSGTTGTPKGVMISHRNLLSVSKSSSSAMHMEDDFVHMLFLPLAHVFARLMVYCCLRGPVPTALAEDMSKVPANLQEIRPHFFASVPRLYEKVYDRVLSGAQAASPLKRKLFHWALGVGRRVSQLQQQRRPLPLGLRLQHKLADRLVLHRVRDAFGGRLVFAVSGAAPLNRTIAEFFHACGVLILEGIGQTENTSFSHVNRVDNNKFGTVGLPGEGIEVKIAEDGEVLFRGENVMQGYYKNPEATAETINGDGWLHSGDIGEIDDDGFLTITDRKKDLIITSGGKNVAPQRVERIMRTSHYIGQVMAYGDRRKYLSALITLDLDNLREWAERNGLDSATPQELAAHPKVFELIRGEVEERNKQLASFETIKKFHLLARDFSIEDGELTPTLKLKRKVVVERYREELEALYNNS